MRYTYVRQHDTTDCAAACLAMVCLHYKKEVTITRLRDMMGTDLKGTNLVGLQKAANELGFTTAAVRVDRENFLSDFSLPCIAQVITDQGLAHFVVVFKKTTLRDDGERRKHMLDEAEQVKEAEEKGKKHKCKDYVIIGDPATELKKISLDEFYKNFTGVLLLMNPTSEFKGGKIEKGGMMKRYINLLLPQKKLFFYAILSSVITTILGIASSMFNKILMDEVLPYGLDNLLVTLIIVFSMVSLTSSLIGFVRQWVLIHLSIKIDIPLMLGYFGHIFHLPMKFFATRKTGDITTRYSDANTIKSIFTSIALSLIMDISMAIITGIILFNFGTGPIRGFATTLIIGILISFFTAVFMTRLFYDYFMGKDKLLNLTFSSKISKNLMANVHFDFMGRNKLWLTITGAAVVVCIAFLATRGLSQSIDFTGGRNFKVQFENKVEPEQIRELISSKFGDANVSVIAIGTDGKTVRISTNYRIEEEGNNIDSEIEAYLYETLKPVLTQNITLETFIDRENHTGGSIISSQKVGPSIADDIKVSAIWSVVLALIAIGIYILIRFRNIAYSIGSVAALACDTIIILGAYSICWGWMPFSLEIDQTFIGAILTAIGYSINDKVVIFDRVREFFGLYPKRDKFQLFNDSLNTTLARTINTSLSTLIVLLCIFILGGDSIRSFAFAMILGVVFGTMSSLFVASPIAYILIKGKKSSELNEVSE